MELVTLVFTASHCFSQDSLGSNARARGRVHRLASSLQEAWAQRHEVFQGTNETVPRASSKPSCASLQFCVCASPGVQAYAFHQRVVSTLKPCVRIPRKRKGDPPQQPQSDHKAKAQSLQERKPVGRILLEGALLVARLQPVGADDEDSEPEPFSSWAAAASQITGDKDKDKAKLKPLWLHVNYVNYQSYHFTALVLQEVGPDDVAAARGQHRLSVPAVLVCKKSWEIFADLIDFAPAWRLSWFEILSDEKCLQTSEMRPCIVEVAPVAARLLPDSVVWQGLQRELELRASKPKTKGQKRANRSGPLRRAATRAKRLKPGQAAGHSTPASNAHESDASDGSDADLLQLLLDDHQSESKSDSDRDELEELLAMFEEDVQDDAQVGAAPACAAACSTEEAAPAQPSRPEPKVVPAAPKVTASKVPAASRAKLVTEHSLPLPGLGSIRFNSRTNTLTAHCAYLGHGDCRRQRTCKPAGASCSISNLGQGRPLGLLTAWLQDGHNFETKDQHVAEAELGMDHARRVRARAELAAIDGAAAFFAYERPKAAHEAQDEPDFLR